MITTVLTDLTATPVVTELTDRWHHADDGWFPFFPVVPLLFLGLWVLLFALVFRRRWRMSPGQSAEAVLADRYARGEIDEAEYRERRTVLRRRKD